MGEQIFRRESATEYFKELVEQAIARQGVVAGELTAYYIVQLLNGFVHQPADGCHEQPLGVRLVQALEAGGVQQRISLRKIGDVSLFMSGFFADSFRRKLVDVDYYVQIGGVAYQALSRQEADALAPVFSELAGKFPEFVDVLSDVSERSGCSSNLDLLRLYERWLKTGSPRSGQLLVEHGVVPNGSLRDLKVQ